MGIWWLLGTDNEPRMIGSPFPKLFGLLVGLEAAGGVDSVSRHCCVVSLSRCAGSFIARMPLVLAAAKVLTSAKSFI